MKLEVLTPDRHVFNGEVTSVKVPGTEGEFEVLNNHSALVSSLKTGTVRIIKKGGEKQTFKIGSGFIEVLRNEISLLVQGYTEE